jgi:hypothetical protein
MSPQWSQYITQRGSIVLCIGICQGGLENVDLMIVIKT